jgi:hypothetical protein
MPLISAHLRRKAGSDLLSSDERGNAGANNHPLRVCRQILYSQVDKSGSDLMPVENFK